MSLNFGSVLDALQALYNLLFRELFEGERFSGVLLVTLASGGVFQRIITNTFKVRRAVIQHIGATTTEVVTITVEVAGTAAQGVLLNPPAISGQGGGTLEVNNVDLNKFFFVRTTAALTLSVYYER